MSGWEKREGGKILGTRCLPGENHLMSLCNTGACEVIVSEVQARVRRSILLLVTPGSRRTQPAGPGSGNDELATKEPDAAPTCR
jgi:hypothetical protein